MISIRTISDYYWLWIVNWLIFNNLSLMDIEDLLIDKLISIHEWKMKWPNDAIIHCSEFERIVSGWNASATAKLFKVRWSELLNQILTFIPMAIDLLYHAIMSKYIFSTNSSQALNLLSILEMNHTTLWNLVIVLITAKHNGTSVTTNSKPTRKFLRIMQSVSLISGHSARSMVWFNGHNQRVSQTKVLHVKTWLSMHWIKIIGMKWWKTKRTTLSLVVSSCTGIAIH